MQYSIDYDDTVLDYDLAQNFMLSGLTAGNIGNPNPGDVTISWVSDDVVNGTTIADNTPIVELCFTTIGGNGTSSGIDFVGSPIIIEVTGPGGVINPTFNNGTVNVGTGGGGGGGGGFWRSGL